MTEPTSPSAFDITTAADPLNAFELPIADAQPRDDLALSWGHPPDGGLTTRMPKPS
jgi:hypothetical protein